MKRSTITIAALLAGLLLLGPIVAFANGPCRANDAWTGRDKAMHLKAGLAIGAGVTFVTKEPFYGFLAGTAAGALAELKDLRTSNHVCSLQDFLVTSAGAAAGAYGTAWLILPRKDGVQVAFVKRF